MQPAQLFPLHQLLMQQRSQQHLLLLLLPQGGGLPALGSGRRAELRAQRKRTIKKN